LDDLFDVAHADVLHIVEIAEDRQFWFAQQEKGQCRCMGSVDLKLAKMEERRYKRQLENESRRRKEGERIVRPTEVDYENVSDIAGTSTDSNDSSATEDEGISTTKSFAMTPKRITTVRSTNIINPAVAAALDRIMVSDRNATFIVAAVAKSIRHEPSELVLNKESVRNARRQNRTSTACMVKESFCLDGPLGPLLVGITLIPHPMSLQ
jgi:hypothetical protein